MGGFYGSIHVRGGTPDAVRAAVKHTAEATGREFLVTRPERGWITVFPSESGQSPAISKILAKQLPDVDHILHLIVHDDDVFVACHYQRGKLVDEFNSSPSYFEEVSAKARARLKGKPELLVPLLKDANSLPRLREIMRQQQMSDEPEDNCLIASEQMTAFASLLDIPHVPCSYEALDDDDPEGGGDLFEGIPSHADLERIPAEAGRAERKVQHAAEGAEVAAALSSGILEAELSPVGGIQMMTSPIWTVDRSVQDGILVAWIKHAVFSAGEAAPLQSFRRPWQQASPTAWRPSPSAYTLHSNSSGRLLVVCGAFGEPGFNVFERESGRVIASGRGEIPEWVMFAADESCLVLATRSSLERIDLTGIGKRHRSPLAHQIFGAALSPDGSRIVLASLSGFEVLDAASFRILGRIRVFERPAPPSLPPIYRLALMMNRSSRLQQGFASELPTGAQFTADGESLILTTDTSILVYPWRPIAEGDYATPRSHVLDIFPMMQGFAGEQQPGQLWYPIHVPGFNLVVAASSSAAVYTLDLASNSGGQLLTVPGAFSVHRLGITQDSRTLITESSRLHRPRGGGIGTMSDPLRLWNLAAIRDSERAQKPRIDTRSLTTLMFPRHFEPVDRLGKHMLTALAHVR